MADKITQEYVTLVDITGGDTYPGMAESCQIRLLAGLSGDFRGNTRRCGITLPAQ